MSAQATARSTPRHDGFWSLRDLLVVFWLAAAAVAAQVHPFIPAPRWLTIHLLRLGSVTHAILGWSRHFADPLLHTAPRPGDRGGSHSNEAMRSRSLARSMMRHEAMGCDGGISCHPEVAAMLSTVGQQPHVDSIATRPAAGSGDLSLKARPDDRGLVPPHHTGDRQSTH